MNAINTDLVKATKLMFKLTLHCLAGVILLLLASVAITPRIATDAEAAAGDKIPIIGKDWLKGQGVDVIYPAIEGDTGEISEKYGYRYQCVELAQRLYAQRLGYPNIWPVSIAKDMPGVAGKVIQGKDFSDLIYYPNGSNTPPRPGDLIIWGSNHVAVVSQMAGKWVRTVSQNGPWSNGQPSPYSDLTLSLNSNGTYTLSGNPMGWIHSPRWDKLGLLVQQRAIKQIQGTEMAWNEDQDTIYLYVWESLTRRMLKEGVNAANEIGGSLITRDPRNILALTTVPYSQCVARKVASLVQTDARFNPNQGVRSVDYTLKYAGSKIWVRPWGGSKNGQWIEISGVNCEN